MTKLKKIILAILGAGVISAAGNSFVENNEKISLQSNKTNATIHYNAAKTKYSYTPKDNALDRVQVEVGDDNASFTPQVNIKRWDGEINASIRLVDTNIPGNTSFSDDGTKITWQKKQGQNIWKAVFYDKPEASDAGGFEFEIHLPAKPPQNYLDFAVDSTNLEWLYQPALTQEYANGYSEEFKTEIVVSETQVKDLLGNVLVERPENVVGSYAVYYKNVPLTISGGKEYGTGQAFMLYRPHITDSAGHSTWGSWTLNEGILRLTVPQEFLNTATYPVIVDPTIGYTTAGGSSTATSSDTIRMTSNNQSMPVDGVVYSVSVYTKLSTGDTGTAGVRGGVYKFNGSTYDLQGATGAEVSVTSPSTAAWKESVITNGATLTSGSTYFYAIYNQYEDTSAEIRTYYNSGDSAYNKYKSSQDYPNWPNPLSGVTATSSQYSIYARYIYPNTVDYYGDWNADDYGVLGGYSSFKDGYGQTFEGDGKKITKAYFNLRKESSPTGNATAKLYAITGTHGTDGKPTGAALATSDNLDVSTISATRGDVAFTFSGANQYTLTDGTYYVITVEYSGGDLTNYIEVWMDTSSPSHAGNYCYYDGSNWTASGSNDLSFYVIGETVSAGGERRILITE